jgi:hypothetical protein
MMVELKINDYVVDFPNEDHVVVMKIIDKYVNRHDYPEGELFFVVEYGLIEPTTCDRSPLHLRLATLEEQLEYLGDGIAEVQSFAMLTGNADVNTVIHYMYRDADNYKQTAKVVFSGEINKEDLGHLMRSLRDGDKSFIPGQVNLPDLQERMLSGWKEDADHPWHQITMVGLTTEEPTDDNTRTIYGFVKEIMNIEWNNEYLPEYSPQKETSKPQQ